jgi:hypothetical protein
LLFTGSLDEIRISATALSGSWLAADYTFGATPSIVQVGAETTH